jgi:DNA-binding NtrC family response regulator
VRLVVFSGTPEISAADVNRALGTDGKSSSGGPQGGSLLLEEVVKIAEQGALIRALKAADGNRAKAARLLGIARRTLYNKLVEHGLMKWRPGDPE